MNNIQIIGFVEDWTYGVDPRIVEYIQERHVAPARLQVISETEVIIWNPGAPFA